MDNVVKDIETTTLRILIEKERERLVKLKEREPSWSDARSEWAKKRDLTFTENSAEQIFEEKKGDCSFIYGSAEGYCQICGQLFGLDEKFAILSFSFCGEYDCSMSLHLDCPKLVKLRKNKK